MKEKSSPVFALGALLAALGVVLGAFGAHALEERLAAAGRTAVWETAVLYHLVHAVAIIALGAWAKAGQGGGLQAIAWIWVVGILLFSGSLYWLSLGGPGFVGPVTPLGGLAFIGGWLWFGVHLLRSGR